MSLAPRRLVYVGAFQDVGRVRVTWSDDWEEYCARLVDSTGELVAEYFTDDRGDALATADRLLAALAARQGLS